MLPHLIGMGDVIKATEMDDLAFSWAARVASYPTSMWAARSAVGIPMACGTGEHHQHPHGSQLVVADQYRQPHRAWRWLSSSIHIGPNKCHHNVPLDKGENTSHTLTWIEGAMPCIRMDYGVSQPLQASPWQLCYTQHPHGTQGQAATPSIAKPGKGGMWTGAALCPC